MKSIDDEVEKKLKSEIELLNPQVRAQKLMPLEGDVTKLQTMVKSLNVDYKLNIMNDLDMEATDLEEKASITLNDMGKVNSDIQSATLEMKTIADGLKKKMKDTEINVSTSIWGYLFF